MDDNRLETVSSTLQHLEFDESLKQLYRFKEAGNGFQYFSNSYTLKDEYCHCLTSDATIMVSYKLSIIGKQVAIIYFT